MLKTTNFVLKYLTCVILTLELSSSTAILLTRNAQVRSENDPKKTKVNLNEKDDSPRRLESSYDSSCYVMENHECVCSDNLCGPDLCKAGSETNIWTNECGSCTCSHGRSNSTSSISNVVIVTTSAPVASPAATESASYTIAQEGEPSYDASCYVMADHVCVCSSELCGPDLCAARANSNIWTVECGSCNCVAANHADAYVDMTTTLPPTSATVLFPSMTPTKDDEMTSGSFVKMALGRSLNLVTLGSVLFIQIIQVFL